MSMDIPPIGANGAKDVNPTQNLVVNVDLTSSIAQVITTPRNLYERIENKGDYSKHIPQQAKHTAHKIQHLGKTHVLKHPPAAPAA